MADVIKRLIDSVDGRDVVAVLGLASLIAGVAMWSVPLTLVVLGSALLVVTVVPLALVNLWKSLKR